MFRHRAELLELLQKPTMQDQLDIMISGEVPLGEAADVFERILTRQHGKFFFTFDNL